MGTISMQSTGQNGQTQIATRTSRFNDGMHHLVAAQDGIGGAGLDAQGAADTPSFVNHGHHHGAFNAMFWI
jgi:hypothetical protein